MSGARDALTRAGVAIAMALCVAGLIRLTAPQAPTLSSALQFTPDTVLAMADRWTGEIDFAPAYSALDPALALSAGGAAALFNPADDYWGLPRTPGYETVAGHCAACHTLQIVMQQRQSEDGWNALIDWMIERQGMAAPDDATREEIVSYLAREFGTQ